MVGWWALWAAWAAGCAGSPGLGFYTGACETERARCRARCEQLEDPRRCLDRCDQDARSCQTRQGGEGVVLEQPPLRIGEHQALIVELDAGRVRASEAAQTRIQGEARPIDGAFAFAPGAGLEVVFALPPTAREAELEITHGPGAGAGPCFVTMVVGDTPLAGRYAPPRGEDGGRRRESWNLTPLLPPPAEEGEARTLRLFIYNNDAAGSAADYHLERVHLIFRAMERPAAR
ncbi:MAG: hypothetical protein KC583_19055 [Myxococcales bacterium]|nr:hypothetical protein [Myxococcales bacterium]